MFTHSAFLSLLILLVAACRPKEEVAKGPGNPAPVAGPETGPAVSPQAGRAGRGGTRGSAGGISLPGRADEAPLVRVAQALTLDSLLGRRVRVVGHCTAAGAGRRAGSWTLEDAGWSIEVRGLVPYSCTTRSGATLTIFAQIEPAASGSSERLLLRLPD